LELEDCTFPLLAGVECTDDPEVAFADVDVALLVGASPRRAGMERSELLSLNGEIFKPQGQALGRNARKHVKVVVVGNPANTNALVALRNASGLEPRQFTALTRLDHNRATLPTGCPPARAGGLHSPDDGVGKPLFHAVSRPAPLPDRRSPGVGGGGRPGVV